MKIIHVNTPLQDENTLNPQIIDGKVKHWCVQDTLVKAGHSFKMWLSDMTTKIQTDPKFAEVEGIYLYDITPIGARIAGVPNEAILIVRFDYIKKDIKPKYEIDLPMSIYSPRGHKVTITEQTLENGYKHDSDLAKEFLTIGEVYTVKSIDIYDWSSYVTLQEIPNKQFNTDIFIDA